MQTPGSGLFLLEVRLFFRKDRLWPAWFSLGWCILKCHFESFSMIDHTVITPNRLGSLPEAWSKNLKTKWGSQDMIDLICQGHKTIHQNLLTTTFNSETSTCYTLLDLFIYTTFWGLYRKNTSKIACPSCHRFLYGWGADRTLSTDLPSPLGGMNTTGMESMVTFLVFLEQILFFNFFVALLPTKIMWNARVLGGFNSSWDRGPASAPTAPPSIPYKVKLRPWFGAAPRDLNWEFFLLGCFAENQQDQREIHLSDLISIIYIYCTYTAKFYSISSYVAYIYNLSYSIVCSSLSYIVVS